MSEEEKKAIEYLKGKIEINNIKIKNIEDKGDKSLIGLGTMHDVYKLQNLNYIILLNLIEKQDKMINLMADEIRSCHDAINSEGWLAEYANCTVEEIKENFRKRVEEDAKN